MNVEGGRGGWVMAKRSLYMGVTENGGEGGLANFPLPGGSSRKEGGSELSLLRV